MLDGLSAIENFFNTQEEENYIRVGDPQAVEKFYKAIQKDFNLDELKEVLDCDDNMLLVSSAGSGKTTTLILKIIRDYLSGKLTKKIFVNGVENNTSCKVLVSTFLKSGATDLVDKFNELIKKYNIKGIDTRFISFRTIHSEVYQALTDMKVDLKIIQETETYKYIRKACKDFNIHSVMSGKGKDLTNEEIGDISCILTYSRNRLDNTKYTHPLMDEYGMGEIELKAVLDEFKLLKAADRVHDFEDLEEMLYHGYMKYPNVQNHIKNRYDYIYIDEFQDTSQLQYAILKPYFESAKGFIVVGDDDQCIYSWRGSDPSLIQYKLEEDYKPVVKKLSINRRCSENILTPVIPSIEKNVDRHKKNLKAAKTGGKVRVVVDGGAGYLMECINQDLYESKKIGILGRTNDDLLIPALLLELDGYSSFSLSKSVNMAGRIPGKVLGAMELITQRYNENFESYFKMFLNKYNGFQATKLCDILSTTPEYSIYNLPLEDIQYSAPDLFSIIRMLRTEVEKDPVMAYVSLLEIIEQDVFNGKTIYAQRARDFTYYIRKIILEHDKLKGLTIDELYVLFTKTIAQNLEKKKPRQMSTKDMLKDMGQGRKNEPFVRITTVHDAKGKQWDSVYIWNDVNGCFPNSVGNRELTKEEFEEERRVHYIAWTRAVEKLTVFTRSDRIDGFLSECDLSEAEIVEVSERKRYANTDSSQVKNALLANSKKPVVNEKPKEDKYVTAVKNYVSKYTGYSYICSQRGTNLDIALVKLGNMQNLIKRLQSENLNSYPVDMLEDVISDLIEKIANE